jgi:hypothetical protein
MTFNIQYVGFKSKAVVREYSFLLRESSVEPHEITFTILNEAFRSHGLRYQDAPDLCSLKLHREMANSVDDPLKSHYRITGTELDDYRDSHSPKPQRLSIREKLDKISSNANLGPVNYRGHSVSQISGLMKNRMSDIHDLA